ncbi:YeeE/YedE family protein [Massilia niastensis]|uniref:YeeE/YedE family protein n=1 Tax=Massilia niastensis TaxID=544911 RepID=UPI00039A94CE|nr:YeeE/YedE family protein [Massilia niastensis]
MTIDWTSFTPWMSLAGGLMVGLATVMFLLLNGRIAGISGILGGLLRPARGDVAWRLAFIGGLVISPLLFSLAAPLPEGRVEASNPVLLMAGLLVGIGTRYGSGCTSGHGVCGLSRRSPRSVAATIAFLCAGFVTVYFVRHVIG